MEHPRGENPLGIETGVGERCAELGAEDPGEHADLTHGDRNRRRLGGGTQMQDARRLGQCRRRSGDLDDVGVELLTLFGDVLQVDRRGLRVVVADDPLGLAEAANLGGDVHLEVDVVDAQRHRLAQELLPLVFVAAPQAAVDPAANREDQRRGTILEYPLQFRLAAQTVDPQLDQFDAGLGCLLPFLEQRRVPASPDRYADHNHPAPCPGAHWSPTAASRRGRIYVRRTPLDDCMTTPPAVERGRCRDVNIHKILPKVRNTY